MNDLISGKVAQYDLYIKIGEEKYVRILVKHTHGKGGQLIFRALGADEGGGVEILSLDRGPGMADVAQCISDGYSTAGSAGTGLGAVTRLSSVFDIHSLPASGTTILSRVCARFGAPAGAFEIGAVCLPVQGETVSGDVLEARFRDGLQSVMVADGLGHGPLAFEAAHQAKLSFLDHEAPSSAADKIQSIHSALRSTRGAAVAVAEIDVGSGLLHYSGLGNVSGIIYAASGEPRRMISHNGTAGVRARKVQQFDYPWGPGSVLIMHSDGLVSQWSLDKYQGLLRRHPALIAGILFRDFSRGRDDASVLVVRRDGNESTSRGVA